MKKNKHNITAIIYDKRNRIISIGKNSYVKTHPLQAKYAKSVGEEDKIFLHAEIHAITRCPQISKAHTMKVFRYNKAGEAVLAKPCKTCRTAIDHTNIKEVYHT